MGVKAIETRKVEFADMLPGVAAGRWTMNTALFITPERCREVDFSDPIWALSDGLIVRQGNPRGITSYASIAAHREAKLGALRGTVQIVEAYQDGVPRDRVVEFGTQDEALAAIRNGQVDAYSGTALGHRTLLAKLKAADLELAPDFQPPARGGHALAGFGAFSFAKSNQAFVARFNATLASYLGGTEHRAMMARHGFTEAEIDPAIAMRGRLAELYG
jgi:polar amino acid transport system substrate-binding protein